MTPKEKANELVDKYWKQFVPQFEGHFLAETQTMHILYDDQAKQCALIAVDEIIEAINNLQYERKTDFWENVKTEIEKL
jgi:hypothetical protein